MTLGVSQPLQIYIYTFLMQRFTFVLFAAMRERHLSKYIFLKKRKKERNKQKKEKRKESLDAL